MLMRLQLKLTIVLSHNLTAVHHSGQPAMQNATANIISQLDLTAGLSYSGQDAGTEPSTQMAAVTTASLAWVSGFSQSSVSGSYIFADLPVLDMATTILPPTLTTEQQEDPDVVTILDALTPANRSSETYERSTVVHILWVSIIVLGALGNGLVIYIMGCQGERSATNCFIINLAVSDFAVLTIVVPFTITMFTSFDWMYGQTMCKITVYLIYVTLQATCLTLTAMTIDRYFAIVHPITSLRDRTPRGAILICLATWLASSVICIPFVVYSDLEYQSDDAANCHVYCNNQWPSLMILKLVTVAFVMSTYIIPLLVIIVCYTLILKHLWRNKTGILREMPSAPGRGEGPVIRRRRKVARMVFMVVVAFAVTWLPIHVFNLCLTFIDTFPRTEVMYNVKIMCHTLSYLNSCINPFIYAFLGDGFRRAFRRSFPRCTTRIQVFPEPVANETAGPSATAEMRLAVSSKDPARHVYPAGRL